jgi:hypothetical protein
LRHNQQCGNRKQNPSVAHCALLCITRCRCSLSTASINCAS